jgi:serine phosphatase RsbU (regulator of sigma subunit)
LFSQNIDSLKQDLKRPLEDTSRVNTLIELAKAYKSKKSDTTVIFIKEAYNISFKSGYLLGQIHACFQYGTWYRTLQNMDSALFFFNKSIQIASSVYDTVEVCKSLTQIGNMYSDVGEVENSIRYHEKSLKLGIASRSYEKVGMNLYNLGNEYKKIGATKKALGYYQTARLVFETINDESKLASILNTIGILYVDWLSFDKAIETYNEAFKLYQKNNNFQGEADLKINMGLVYIKLGEYDKAIESYQEARTISQTIKNVNKEVYALIHLALVNTDLFNFKEADKYIAEINHLSDQVSQKDIVALSYQGIGYCKLYQNKCHEALDYLLKCMEISKELQLTERLNSSYIYISQAYMCVGDAKKASEYFRSYEQTRDNDNKRVNDARVKFETAQQDKEIKLLNKQQEINQKLIVAKEKETKQQRLIIYIFIAGLVLIVLFLIVVINQYRQKKKANVLLAEQKMYIEDQKKEIEDSINYAQRIQKAVLTLSDTQGTLLEKSFVLFHPKSIVSGDFYWATVVDHWTIVTVADCTGHGVPGAFMSMLGVSYLSEIVRKKEVIQASHVLQELRKYIIDALKQQGRIGEQKDGMDIALCAINNQTLECQFAGANNPLYLYKKSTQELKEIKGDKMPVAIYERMNEYTNHVFQLEKGDRIYMFSDGYPDQFGGPKGKKFMYKGFKEILLQTSHLPVNVQCNMLDANLTAWVDYIDKSTGHKFEQIDDITIMGIEI